MWLGWTFVIFLAVVGILGIRRELRPQHVILRVIGLVVFVLVLSASPILLWFLDSLSSANDCGRWYDCKKNMEDIAQAVRVYCNRHGEYPMNLQALAEQGNLRPYCSISRNGPPVEYKYRIPKNETEVMFWDSQPHSIEHKYLPFRSETIRNLARANGIVESVPESTFRAPWGEQ